MKAFNLVGDRAVAEGITCVVELILPFAGYALAILWIKHYLARSAGGTIAAKVIGVLLAVPAGNFSTRLFTGFYPCFDERQASAILVGFIIGYVLVCFGLLAGHQHPAGQPPEGGTDEHH